MFSSKAWGKRTRTRVVDSGGQRGAWRRPLNRDTAYDAARPVALPSALRVCSTAEITSDASESTHRRARSARGLEIALACKGCPGLEQRAVVAIRRVGRDLTAERDRLGGRALEACGGPLGTELGFSEGRGRSDDSFFHDVDL